MNSLDFGSSLKAPSKTIPQQKPMHLVHIFLYRRGVSEPEYLLFHSHADSGAPGGWQVITGIHEAGDSGEQIAKREVFEKTGLLVHQLKKSGLTKSCLLSSKSAHKEDIYYAHLDCDMLPTLSSEHNAFGWFSYTKARRLINFAPSKKYLDAVEQHRKQHAGIGSIDKN